MPAGLPTRRGARRTERGSGDGLEVIAALARLGPVVGAEDRILEGIAVHLKDIDLAVRETYQHRHEFVARATVLRRQGKRVPRCVCSVKVAVVAWGAVRRTRRWASTGCCPA